MSNGRNERVSHERHPRMVSDSSGPTVLGIGGFYSGASGVDWATERRNTGRSDHSTHRPSSSSHLFNSQKVWKWRPAAIIISIVLGFGGLFEVIRAVNA